MGYLGQAHKLEGRNDTTNGSNYRDMDRSK
jgi:hypothetical protein